MRKAFPTAGRPVANILADLEGMQAADANGRGGRVPLCLFKASDSVDALGRAAFAATRTARRRDPAHRGNIVAAETAHPAFDKAARLMDLEARRVAMGPDLRADVADWATVMHLGVEGPLEIARRHDPAIDCNFVDLRDCITAASEPSKLTATN
ncbi:MAG: hypothetical protein FJX57_00575 [Alphaproteobacteria bacterium]|nr:hypothetical protein [Alphaproteobacteria bacterium]